MEEDVTRLERALVTLLRLGNTPRVHERLTERAEARIPRASIVVLATVEDHGPIRLSDLAAAISLDVSTASRHAARLCRDGLLEKVVDEDDHRAAVISLSDEGRRTLADVRAARHDAVVRLLHDWSPDEVRRLAVGLERLNRVLQDSTLADEGGDR